jgi:hypothetical protein
MMTCCAVPRLMALDVLHSLSAFADDDEGISRMVSGPALNL